MALPTFIGAHKTLIAEQPPLSTSSCSFSLPQERGGPEIKILMD